MIDDRLILYYFDFVHDGKARTTEEATAYFASIADSYSQEDRAAAAHYVARMSMYTRDVLGDCTCAGCTLWKERHND